MSKVLALLMPLCLLVSCQLTEEDVYIHSLNGVWEQKAIQKFNFEITDAQNPKNIIFVVRNNNDYTYSNLRLFSRLYEKNQKNPVVDTLNYILAQPNGAWIGSGFGDTKETLFQYKMDYQFPKNGTYTIEIQHAMRQDTLKGIEDLGIKIEPAKTYNGK